MISAAITVVAPSAPAVTFAQAKSFLRRDDCGLDDQIALMLAASIGDIEASTGTRMIGQTVEIRADCFGDLDLLPIGPVTAVTEIRYLDPAGVEQLLDPTAYYLTGAGLERGIRGLPATPLPLVQRRRGAVRVRLAVGYGPSSADVPTQLRWAVLALLRGKFEDRVVDIDSLILNHRLYA